MLGRLASVLLLGGAAACGGNVVDPGRALLECALPDPTGRACETVDPVPPSLDCQWDRSCGAYALCLCGDDGHYDCDVVTVHAGDACTADHSQCFSDCDDPASTQSCSCVDGTWACKENCPAGCPSSLPSGSCNLPEDIACGYETLFSCRCRAGAWECAG